MAVVQDGRVFFGGYRFDTSLHTMGLNYGAEEVEDTVFGDGTRSVEGGLKTYGLSFTGRWAGGSGSIDEQFFSDVGTNDRVITVSHNTATDGDEAYLAQYLWATASPIDASVGDAHEITGDAAGRSSPLVRGNYIHNATVTATGTGAAVQVGAVAADENLYAVLHVISSSGDGSQTLDVTVESDDASGFASPTTQITFSQITTTVGSEWATPVSGAITDDWWRTSHTVGGTGSPSFEYIVAIGIL